MSIRYLLISDPPHGDVDAAAAASHFGLAAAEVRMKSNYGLPEIWFAGEDEAELRDTSAALEAVGLKIVVVSGSDLVETPDQTPAESFEFTDAGLRVDLDGAGLTLAYGAPVIAVYGRPRVDMQEGKAPARSVASQLSSWGRSGVRRPSTPDDGMGGLGTSPFLDLYTQADEGLLRISIVQEVTSFSQLADNLPHGLSAMQNLVAECENHFENARVDRRLVDMTLRGLARVVTGPSPRELRTGFSYATQALAELLGSLSPDLKDIHQTDLSSRLAYLTTRSRTS